MNEDGTCVGECVRECVRVCVRVCVQHMHAIVLRRVCDVLLSISMVHNAVV